MKIAINKCYGGFGLSDAAYEKLIEWGVPVVKYGAGIDGEVIFDRELTPVGEDTFNDIYHRFKGSTHSNRYWETWLDHQRSHPLLIRVIEEMGAGHREGASGPHASLKIVEIPDGTEYEIDEYDGMERVAETHRTWA